MLNRHPRNLVASTRRWFASSVPKPQALDFDRVPSPRGLPLVGTTLSLLLAGGPGQLHKYMDRRHEELGPIFKDNVGPVTAVFVSDAEEMRNVFAKEGKCPYHIKPESWLVYNEKHGCSRGLFFMDGEEWLFHRRIMNNLLLKGDLSWIETCCDFASNLLLERLHQNHNQEFQNLDGELYKWAMEVIVATLTGRNAFQRHYEELEGLVEVLAARVFMVFETTVDLQLLPARLAQKYRLGRWTRFEDSVTAALEAANEVFEMVKTFEETDGLLDKMMKTDMTPSDVSEIVVDLLLGAGDTTANAMAWSLYLLSKNKPVEEQLRENLNRERNPALLRNAVRETLRLYPPAAFLTRFLPEPATVCGYTIPSNTLIVMSIYTSGRDPKYFRNPERFLPDRWVRGAEQHFPKISASLPFGIGARSCIGKRVAESQLQDTLGKIVKSFELELCNEKDVQDVSRMIIKPSEPIRLRFNKP